MAENETENTAAENAENTVTEEPTTPTLEELAAQVATLAQKMADMQALLEDVIGEGEYELSYSGEEVDEVCAKMFDITPSADTITNTIVKFAQVAPTYGPTQINSALDKANTLQNPVNVNAVTSRIYPLRQKWGSFTVNMTVNHDDGEQWSSGTVSNAIPQELQSPSVFMVCDWNKKSFRAAQLSYKVSGRNIEWSVYLSHTSSQSGTYQFKIYYMIIGKTNGGTEVG